MRIVNILSEFTEWSLQLNVVNMFQDIKNRSDDKTETFQSIISNLEIIKTSCHQFCFRFPIQTIELATRFAQVMKIKSQEAHRFVPVISSCEFIEPRHLGFSRKIQILDGPLVHEHVLLDQASDSIIFIEESVKILNGEVYPGTFISINTLSDENGYWYFAGTYLYADKPTDTEVVKRQENV
ncbi:MAG: DUF1857 family protein [Parachlamydiaceae bacterium]|nr:DUF1857 family protein [Parachlamydiaceae bacterium]